MALFAVVDRRVLEATVEAVRGLSFDRPAVATGDAPVRHTDTQLQARLEAAISLDRGTSAAVVVDLEDGATGSVNAERIFPAASLFKLPILVETLRQISAHQLDPDQALEIRQEHWTDGSGVLQARVGDHVTVRELMRLMIQESDNIAALVLLDAVGVDSTNDTLASLGLDATRLRARGDDGQHETSAADMARLFEAMAAGQLVDATISGSALDLLASRQAVSWLADELPWWVKVAHKWGDLPGARHDAGIVYTPRGNFVTVVLTEGGRAEEARRAIGNASRAAYDHLGHRAGVTT